MSQLLLADLRELRGVLDNLIWKGSELSASMRLKDVDIKDTLKQLEEKWDQAVKRAEKKLIDLDDLRMDWAEREDMLVNMESWVTQAEDQLQNEQGLSSRDEDSLKEALAYYEVNLGNIRHFHFEVFRSFLRNCRKNLQKQHNSSSNVPAQERRCY